MNYEKLYNDIIEKAKSENRIKGQGTYYESHHIIPRCMGGEGKVHQWKTHPNIVLLTAKEHFVCHKLLCEIYPDNHKMLQAYWFFMNGGSSKNQNRNYIISGREYERLKNEYSSVLSENISGKNNPMYGKDCWNKGLTGTHSSWVTKKNHTKESREKISLGKIGEKNPSSKLTKQDVIEIRNKYIPRKYTIKMLVKEYGVSDSTIDNIIRKVSWKHI